MVLAGNQAIAAEGTSTAAEIDLGEASPTRLQDSFAAGLNTVSATLAGLDERCLCKTPRRTQRRSVSMDITAEELSAVHLIGSVRCHYPQKIIRKLQPGSMAFLDEHQEPLLQVANS
jgi:hypothetical protein